MTNVIPFRTKDEIAQTKKEKEWELILEIEKKFENHIDNMKQNEFEAEYIIGVDENEYDFRYEDK